MLTVRLTTSTAQPEVMRRLAACTDDDELRLFVGHVGNERFRLRLGGCYDSDGIRTPSLIGKAIAIPGGTLVRGFVFAPVAVIACLAVAAAQGWLLWRIEATSFRLFDLLLAEGILAVMLLIPLIGVIAGSRRIKRVVAVVIEQPMASDAIDAQP